MLPTPNCRWKKSKPARLHTLLNRPARAVNVKKRSEARTPLRCEQSKSTTKNRAIQRSISRWAASTDESNWDSAINTRTGSIQISSVKRSAAEEYNHVKTFRNSIAAAGETCSRNRMDSGITTAALSALANPVVTMRQESA